MNPGIKAKWVAALRSGEYVQGKYCLKEISNEGEAKYCCLGVLCDLAVKEGVIKEIRNRGYVFYEDMHAVPPASVVKWSGLKYCNPAVNGRLITDYNDGLLYSFNQIADLIEKEL